MKRREALQNLVAVTATLMYVPSCTVEEAIPSYSNLPISNEEYRLVKHVVEAMLPNKPKSKPESTEDIPVITTPESSHDFVLTMINDAYSPLQIGRYARGLRLFHQFVQDEYKQRFAQLNEFQHILLFTEMTESEAFPKSLQFFLEETKRLAVRHFTSSEYFLTQKMEWEFIPGRYVGCVSI
ncbi:MAG: gluconate 2-dehydrogenase subunit 3 family protein [Bacteroidota bacterium]